MKAIINISQKDALLNGSNVYGHQEIEFDPADLTPEQRAELLKSSIDREDRYETWRPDRLDYSDLNLKIIEANIDSFRLILETRMAARRGKEAKTRKAAEKLIVDFLSRPNDQYIKLEAGSDNQPYNWSIAIKTSEQYSNWYSNADDTLKAISLTKNQEAITKLDQIKTLGPQLLEGAKVKWQARQDQLLLEKKAKKEEEEATNKRREDQIREWVEIHGDINQKGRFKEGLLPLEEVLSSMREEAFLPLATWPRYEMMIRSEICTCENLDDDESSCEVDFTSGDKLSLTSDEYDQLTKLRALMPTATITVRFHKGVTDRCEETTIKTSFKVVVKVGEFEFSREYEIKPTS